MSTLFEIRDTATGKVLGELRLVEDLRPGEANVRLFRQGAVQLEIARADKHVPADICSFAGVPADAPIGGAKRVLRGKHR